MGTEGEVVYASTFSAQVEDADLRIRNTTVVPGFGVRFVLAVTVAASRSSAHD